MAPKRALQNILGTQKYCPTS